MSFLRIGGCSMYIHTPTPITVLHIGIALSCFAAAALCVAYEEELGTVTYVSDYNACLLSAALVLQGLSHLVRACDADRLEEQEEREALQKKTPKVEALWESIPGVLCFLSCVVLLTWAVLGFEEAASGADNEKNDYIFPIVLSGLLTLWTMPSIVPALKSFADWCQTPWFDMDGRRTVAYDKYRQGTEAQVTAATDEPQSPGSTEEQTTATSSPTP